MNGVQLRASLALWRSREEFRYRKWRHYVKTKPADDPLRVKWHGLFDEAVTNVRKLVHEIAKLPITQLDVAGDQFIFAREDIIPYAYPDSRGFCTYGVGHLLHQSACTPADYKKYGSEQHPGTEAEAITFFKRDVRPYEAAVRKAFKNAKLKLTQNRFNACVSFCMNIGIGGFGGSTVVRMIRAGHAKLAAEAMKSWNKPPEIQERRQLEVNLFLKN